MSDEVGEIEALVDAFGQYEYWRGASMVPPSDFTRRALLSAVDTLRARLSMSELAREESKKSWSAMAILVGQADAEILALTQRAESAESRADAAEKKLAAAERKVREWENSRE